ncbi:MAG: hypothetical protein GF417_03565 [Candidatus Latescibacteria bacterium]|nr:hypothetical protein [bacterium]MBD3423502.1 hypothetical protein [Candidatus Latescibacterota bacterium]
MRAPAVAITFILLLAAVSTALPEERVTAAGGYVTIYHRDRYREMALRVADLIDESAALMANQLGISRIDSIDLYIAPGREEYNRLYPGSIPEWSEACSHPSDMTICINADAVLKSQRPLRIVLRHELSHILLAQRVEGARCPRWFMEGVAMIQSREWSLTDQWEFLLAVWQKDCPYLDDLTGSFPPGNRRAAYMMSYFAVRELLSEREEDLMTLTAFTRDLGDFNRAFFLTFGETPQDFSARIDVLIKDKYRNILFLAASTPFWSFMVLLFLAAYLLKRRRSLGKLREWEEEEKEAFGENGIDPAES